MAPLPNRPSNSSASKKRPDPVWTPEREAMACRLYLDEGMTASDVAAALGAGLSRGAVIGKIKRLGFSKRAPAADPDGTSDVSSGRKAQRRRRQEDGWFPRRAPSWTPRPLPPLREAPLQGPPTVVAALRDGDCRWPLDDPGAGRMHATLFCAAPALGETYCAAHRAIAIFVRPSGPRP